MMLIQLLLICSMASSPGSAQKQNRFYYSPDKGSRASVIPVGKKGHEDRESRIEIRDSRGRLLRFRSFGSADGMQGRGVGHAEWTADGRFFVFNTDSSGGHMPWNVATYFYSRKKNRFYSLDKFIGPITSDFKLHGINTLKTTRMNFEKKEEKEPVTVRLENLERVSRLDRRLTTRRSVRREAQCVWIHGIP